MLRFRHAIAISLAMLRYDTMPLARTRPHASMLRRLLDIYAITVLRHV